MDPQSTKFPKIKTLFPQLIHNIKFIFLWNKKKFSTNPHSLLILLFFYLLLIIFPSNLAKHFILEKSYIRGLLVNYLIPAVYLTEVVVAAIFFLTLWDYLANWPKKIHLDLFGKLIVLFLVSQIPSLVVGLASSLWLISLERFFELALWLSFGWWVSRNVRWEKRGKIFSLLSVGVAWVSLLAIGQFFLQRQVLGWWFLGEPILSGVGGLARTSLGGVEYLRAYGTFPHPNVLGGVLSVIVIWLISERFWGRAVAGLAGLAVSFSRTAVLSFFGGLIGLALFSFSSNYKLLITNYFPDGDLSVDRRLSLLQSAWEMFKKAPLSGVGLGQFTVHLPSYGLPPGPTLFLEPVHNIFALVAAESGIFALAAFLLLFIFALRETIYKKRWLITVSLFQLIFLGFFDHYLYTLPQGLFLLSLTLGLAFA